MQFLLPDLRHAVFRMVLCSTAVNVGGGLASGILLCIAFDKLATKWVTESSRDPLILAGVTLPLIAAAALACLSPPAAPLRSIPWRRCVPSDGAVIAVKLWAPSFAM